MKYLLCIIFLFPILNAKEPDIISNKIQPVLINQDEVTCLTKLIYHEAGGEDLRTKISVANVARNRVLSGQFEDTFCKVAKQKTNGVEQFPDFGKREFLRKTKDKEKELKVWIDSNKVALDIYLSKEPIGKELYFKKAKLGRFKGKQYLYTTGNMHFFGDSI